MQITEVDKSHNLPSFCQLWSFSAFEMLGLGTSGIEIFCHVRTGDNSLRMCVHCTLSLEEEGGTLTFTMTKHLVTALNKGC